MKHTPTAPTYVYIVMKNIISQFILFTAGLEFPTIRVNTKAAAAPLYTAHSSEPIPVGRWGEHGAVVGTHHIYHPGPGQLQQHLQQRLDVAARRVSSTVIVAVVVVCDGQNSCYLKFLIINIRLS